MHQIEARQLIALHQRKRGARHLDGLVAGEIADQGAGEGGLAGPEVAGQRKQVARLERGGDVDHQRPRGLLIGERHREAEAAGAGGEHRIIRLRQRPYKRGG